MTKLPKKELDKLWKEYKQNETEELRNRIMEQYLHVVKYVAERLSHKLPQNVDVDDLTSAGIFGLMDAITKFDMDRGVKFETYCSNRIRGAILDYLRSMDWVPRLVRHRANKMERSYLEMERRLGRAPTDVEMAQHLGMSIEDYDDRIQEVTAATMVSLSRNWQDGEEGRNSTGVEILEDKKVDDPTRELLQKELVDFVTRQLSKKERLILLLYYYEELTLKEIGQTLELSESRVCQLHSKLLMRLRGQLKKKRQELMG
jgi:RNA polymerase sigma factor for flagellar operon FliA